MEISKNFAFALDKKTNGLKLEKYWSIFLLLLILKHSLTILSDLSGNLITGLNLGSYLNLGYPRTPQMLISLFAALQVDQNYRTRVAWGFNSTLKHY